MATPFVAVAVVVDVDGHAPIAKSTTREGIRRGATAITRTTPALDPAGSITHRRPPDFKRDPTPPPLPPSSLS
jgi:hypothetical protein